MNILILSWRDHKHPQAGGAEQVMREHVKGWIDVGHNVTLFSSRFLGCKEYEKSEDMEIFHSGDQYIGVKINAFKFWIKNNKRFDLVVDQFHGIPFFTPLYVKKPKLAVLQEVAKEVWFLNGFLFPLNYIIGTLGFLIEPLIFLFYKNVPFMVGSESAKKDLVGVGILNKNITIIPHGVIISRFKIKNQKSNIKTVMFLGALTKDKGVEDAIKTFSILDRLGSYRFWIVGGGPYTENLLVLTKSLGIVDKVKFWGFVDQKKKFELLAEAHVLVNPSAREGWGLVNIEANTMGTPVVAYKSAGLVDSVKDGYSGVICKENTPEDLAETVNDLLQSKEKYSHLGIGAKRWAKKFDWKKSRKLSLKFIENIV